MRSCPIPTDCVNDQSDFSSLLAGLRTNLPAKLPVRGSTAFKELVKA